MGRFVFFKTGSPLRWTPGPEWSGNAFTYTNGYGYLHRDTFTYTTARPQLPLRGRRLPHGTVPPSPTPHLARA